MSVVLQYRGREVSDADVAFLRELVERNPGASRRALSSLVCKAWNWVQPNGAPRDMVCRGLMLELHRSGQIVLPAQRQIPPNPLARRRRPVPATMASERIRSPLSALLPLAFDQVRRTKDEAVFNGLIEAHHYLGYMQPVGEHLKYMVRSGDRFLACMAWSSAPRHLGPRDRFIGWSKEERRRNIRFIAYNPRFLILPWVEVPYLASHILGRMARILPDDWQRIYGHRVLVLETFVDPTRYRGTCYRAANWIALGRTTGRGHKDLTHKANRPLKEILAYPLTPRFRELLRG
ncbi:MAG: DUF4338 domain-containing protein [Planctomycetes bacterium]|nr:DUF4338 domain-containing protein [Planctomycetota bacterium]